MNFQEIFIYAEISCNGQQPVIKKYDVLHLAGIFDSQLTLGSIQKEHPTCKVRIIDVQWVVSKA